MKIATFVFSVLVVFCSFADDDERLATVKNFKCVTGKSDLYRKGVSFQRFESEYERSHPYAIKKDTVGAPMIDYELSGVSIRRVKGRNNLFIMGLKGKDYITFDVDLDLSKHGEVQKVEGEAFELVKTYNFTGYVANWEQRSIGKVVCGIELE